MDYPELPKPFYLRKVDGVPTITVAEHEALMRAYVDADRAQRAAQPPQQSAQPVAWMHETPGRVDVIHDEVKKLLSAAATDYLHRPIDKSEKYTIPLYAAAQPVEVQRVRFSESIVREKARLHVQSGHSYRGYWCTNTELAMHILELGFQSGFRSAESAHGIQPTSSEGGAV